MSNNVNVLSQLPIRNAGPSRLGPSNNDIVRD